MKYIYSTDGETANGYLRDELPEELKDADKATRMAAGWYDYVASVPELAENEVAVCTGFKRQGDDFTGIYEIKEVQVEDTKYSVRSIIRELKKDGKFAAVRTMLETANYDWDFIGSNYLSSNDSDFQTMLAAIVAQGILTQAELDELLPKCIWEQTQMA